jgi:hypothetical protein
MQTSFKCTNFSSPSELDQYRQVPPVLILAKIWRPPDNKLVTGYIADEFQIRPLGVRAFPFSPVQSAKANGCANSNAPSTIGAVRFLIVFPAFSS